MDTIRHVLVFGLICGSVFVSDGQTVLRSDYESVISDLFTNGTGYNKNVRPAYYMDNATVVSISYVMSAIINFDEQEESLTTAGYLSIEWTDSYLTWNESDYGGVSMLFVSQNDIWKPDISLRNGFSTPEEFGSDYVRAWVYSDGTVYWEPFLVLKSTCSVDISYFPFDTQTCIMKFVAWSYTNEEVKLMSYTNQNPVYINYGDFTPSAMWELVASEVTNGTDDGSVTFVLKLERKPIFYVVNVILPVFMLSVLNIVTFVLPTVSGERAGFSITVFLSLAVFLTIVAAELPKNSDTTSQLAVYLLISSGMSTSIAMFSVFELRLASRDENPRGKPEIGLVFRKIYQLSQLLQCKKKKTPIHEASRCVSVRPETAKSGKVPVAFDYKEDDEDLRWMDVVNGLDYLMFLLCMSITVLSTIVFLAIAVPNPQREENQYQAVYDYIDKWY